MHKKLGGNATKTAGLNWPEGYPIPYSVKMSNKYRGSWPGEGCHGSGPGWASVGGW